MKTLKINQRPTDRSEKSVMSYFDAVTKQPVITPEEEKELLSRIQQGDKEAKDRLVCGNEYDKVSEIMATEKKEASLDSTLFDEDRTISDTLAQNYFEAPDFGCSESDTATLLQQALDNILKERDANIIRQFFGLEGECKSTQTLSAELNLSRERILQIISKSLEKLRESQFSRQLRMCC